MLKYVFILAFVLCSCSSVYTITTYDENGKVVSVTETKETMAKSITANLEDKTVVQFISGWGAGITVGAQLQTGMTPAVTLKVGKLQEMYGSFKDGADIPKIIDATKENLTISQEGISNASE